LQMTIPSAKNIHDQQWQMGRFLQAQLGQSTVMLNDIGGPSFLSDVHIVDLAGLGTLETGDIIRSGGLTEAHIDALAQRHHVARRTLDEPLFHDVLPPTWVRLGKWIAPPPNMLLTSDIVTIYAVDPTKADELRRCFAEFSNTQLPKDVIPWVKD